MPATDLPLSVVSWNVNSLNSRRERVLNYLRSKDVDVLCLQELKCEDAKVPSDEFNSLGYHTVTMGQKTYNGVAIISRRPVVDVDRGLVVDGFATTDARLIAGTIDSVRIVCVYVPNGQDVGTEKYHYKLAWYAALNRYLKQALKSYPKLVVCGDFNVAHSDLDVHDPQAWRHKILCSEPERAALNSLLAKQLHDPFRTQHPGSKEYSWWDYRALAFPLGHGLRIDYTFVSDALLPLCVDTWIDRNERKGDKPSDHAPVGVRLQNS